MGSKPKQQPPSAEEKALRQRQVNELARLDEEENRRIKRLSRSIGGRSLLRGGFNVPVGQGAGRPSAASSGGAGSSSGGGYSGGSAGGGGGSRSSPGRHYNTP